MKKQHQYITLIVCCLLVLLQAVKELLHHAVTSQFAHTENHSSVHPLHDPHSEPEINNNQWTHGVMGGSRTQGGLNIHPASNLNLYRPTTIHEKGVLKEHNSSLNYYLLHIYPSHNFW